MGGLVMIDEVQHRPELFPTLRVLIDRPEKRTLSLSHYSLAEANLGAASSWLILPPCVALYNAGLREDE